MKTLLLTAALAIGLCGSSSAATLFSLNSSLGTWGTVLTDATQTGFNLNGTGTDFIKWGQVTPGDPANPGQEQSGYEYKGATPPSQNYFTEAQFLLGTFTHHNQAISPGTSVLGATLTINLALAIPAGGATNFTPSFSYNFAHDETDNGANPCPYPPPAGSVANGAGINVNGCADRVEILNNIPTSSFSIGSTLYTLKILGFSQDGGVTFSNDFYTQERLNNPAELYGVITESGVPEPGTIFLVCGAGLIGLSRYLRKRNAS